MKWQDRYRDKLISVEQAAGLVKSGDVVALTMWDSPRDIGYALARRKDELRNVTVQPFGSSYYPWYEPGMEESFKVQVHGATRGPVRQGIIEKRLDWIPWMGGLFCDPLRRDAEPARGATLNHADVFMVKITPPNKHGYCSFGRSVWWNHTAVRSAKIAVGEVDPGMIWTYGDLIHVSEFDYLVEVTEDQYESPYQQPGYLLPVPPPDEAEAASVIGAHAATLVRDGDTIQVGQGSASEAVYEFLGDKNDLGLDTEVIVCQVVDLVKAGVITGQRKNADRGKHTACNILVYPGDPRTRDTLDFVDDNPAFELRSAARQLNPLRIGNMDNVVAINTVLSVDLTGQAVVDHVGPDPLNTLGGQLEYVIGSHYSKGGRTVTALLSTAKSGAASRIVPQHQAGAMIQVPCVYIDYLVTEWGIVNLENRSRRERAEAIISVAHPKFRPELESAARKMYYP